MEGKKEMRFIAEFYNMGVFFLSCLRGGNCWRLEGGRKSYWKEMGWRFTKDMKEMGKNRKWKCSTFHIATLRHHSFRIKVRPLQKNKNNKNEDILLLSSSMSWKHKCNVIHLRYCLLILLLRFRLGSVQYLQKFAGLGAHSWMHVGFRTLHSGR